MKHLGCLSTIGNWDPSRGVRFVADEAAADGPGAWPIRKRLLSDLGWLIELGIPGSRTRRRVLNSGRPRIEQKDRKCQLELDPDGHRYLASDRDWIPTRHRRPDPVHGEPRFDAHRMAADDPNLSGQRLLDPVSTLA